MMTSVPVSVLQRQLESTLQLVIVLPPSMTINDILMARVRLTKANIIMGRILVERENSLARESRCALLFLSLIP